MDNSPTSSPRAPPRRRFAATGRVRSGCLTCKARKKKCDERFTSDDDRCQTCARLGLVCERVPLRSLSSSSSTVPSKRRSSLPGSSPDAEEETDKRPPQTSPSSQQPLAHARPTNSFMALYSLDNASAERILLKYYVERLAPLCTILKDGNNDFRNVLLPMAIDDPSLLYALFAYASIHFSTSSGEPRPSISPLVRLRFETAAARGLSEAIQKNSVSDSTIACALICSTAEVINGDTEKWYTHLQGAGTLIDQSGGPQRLSKTSDGRFLLRNFAYHDIMAALTTGSRPRFSHRVYWVEEDGYLSADCLMGVSHEILVHLSRICNLIADANECLEQPAAEDIVARGEGLARDLTNQPLNLSSTPFSSSELGYLLHHTEALRFAGLLHLYRFMSRFVVAATYEPQMISCVQKILAHVSQVPRGYHCEMGLVFPLFMAGVAVAKNEDRGAVSYIRDRLDHLHSWTLFKHVKRIQEVLEMLWSYKRTDWETVVRGLGWRVSMA